jgi:hypothetical protein
MPRAESSAAYLDRLMSLASIDARAGKTNHAAAANRASVNTAKDTGAGTANHAALAKTNRAVAANRASLNSANDARLGPANHAAVGKINHAAAVNRASVNTAKDTGAGTANQTPAAETNHAAAANHAGVNTVKDTGAGTANQAPVTETNHAAAANHAGVNTVKDTGAGTANQTPVAETTYAGVNASDDTASRTANHRRSTASHTEAGIQLHARSAREASRQIGQFEPLPLDLPFFLSSERKFRRDRGADSKSGRLAVIIGWLPGILLAAGLAWAFTNAPARPQPAKPKPAAAAPAKNPAAEAPKRQEQPMPVSTEQALYLIRSTLLTLNDANRSGNYTVLRDLAAPDFQTRNTAADLSQIFSDLRRRNFDLYAAALLAPQLTAVPALDQRGYLHLTGFFPTRPQQIDFDLLFQNVANQWRLFGIGVNTPQAPTASR